MPALELLNRPLGDLLLLLILEGLPLDTLWQLERDALGGPWHGELDANLGGEMILWELGTHLDSEAQTIATFLINEGIDAEGSCVFTVDAIVHDKEFAVRRID